MEQDFAARWRSVVRHLHHGAECLQATADDIPPELPARADLALRTMFARHSEALADHSVAVSCLYLLISEHATRKT